MDGFLDQVTSYSHLLTQFRVQEPVQIQPQNIEPTNGRYLQHAWVTVMCNDGYTYSDVADNLLCHDGVWTSRPGTCILNAQGKFEMFDLPVMLYY